MPFSNATLIHPQWSHSAPYHFNSLITLNSREVTQNDYGEEEETFTENEASSPIRAYVEPVMSGEEVRRPDQTIVTEAWKISLEGYFPAVQLSDHVVVDGKSHNVLGVAHDDFKTITYLITEMING